MKTVLKYSLALLITLINDAFAQQGAPSCSELQANYQLYQSCATNIPFTNSTGGNNETFQTSCIEEQFVGPTWFFIEINDPGTINLQISQVDVNGFGTDVDFVIWGPFNNLNNICSQLTPLTEVDCSWLPDPIEQVQIPNSNTGDLYVLLIDNYSGVPGFISVAQTGGTGTTNCDFLSSVKIQDINNNDISQLDYCKPETKDLKAVIDITDFSGTPINLRFNYTWKKNGTTISTTSNTVNPTNTITVSETGTYQVTTTAYDITTNPSGDTTNLRVSEADITLKFHTLPTVSISNTNTVCLNTSPVLNATITNATALNNSVDALSYQWYLNNILINGANTSSYTPTLPGNYTVKVSNTPCLEAASNSIRTLSNPVVQINADTELCENDTFTLTSSLTNNNDLTTPSYQWYKDGNAISGATNPTLTVSNATQTLNTSATYHLQVTEQGICLGQSNNAIITINALPTVNTTPFILEQCDYLNLTLDGIAETNLAQSQIINHITNNNPSNTLYYYSDAGLTNPILNFQNFINNNSPFTQNIYVKVVNETVTPNCTGLGVGIIQLQVNPTSVATYPDILAVCPQINQNYGHADFDLHKILIKNNYFPSSDVTISFHLNTSDASTGLNPLTNASQMPIGTTLIHTRVFSNSTNKCEGIGTFNVIVKTPPIRNTMSNVNLCETDLFLLSSKNTEALSGQNPTVQTSYFSTFDNARDNVTPLNPNITLPLSIGIRTIFVRLYDTASQCISIINFDIRVYANPIIFNPTPIKHCGNTTAVFDLTSRINQITNNNNSLQVTFYETVTDLASNNPIPTPNNYQSITKNIYVKVADPGNFGCYSTTILNLIVLSAPGSNTNPTPIEQCNDSGYATFNLRIRETEMAAATGTNNIEFKYYTDSNDAFTNNGNAITNPLGFRNTSIDQQSLYVRLNSKTNFDSETNEACFSILQLDLYVRPYPENHLQETPYIICITKDNIITNPTIIDTELPMGTYSFTWYNGFNAIAGNEIPGQNNNTCSLSVAGEYSVRVTNTSNAANCSSVFNFTTQNSFVPHSISSNPSELIAFGVNNTVTAVAFPQSGDYVYSIDEMNWQESPVFHNIPPGEHTIYVKNIYGCGDHENSFFVVDFPFFFTPNNDNYNDTWNVYGTEILDSIEILIFDRYGKLIKQISPNGEGWDGTYNGKLLPSDDYWFKLTYTKNNITKEFKGHFALKR